MKSGAQSANATKALRDVLLWAMLHDAYKDPPGKLVAAIYTAKSAKALIRAVAKGGIPNARLSLKRSKEHYSDLARLVP